MNKREAKQEFEGVVADTLLNLKHLSDLALDIESDGMGITRRIIAKAEGLVLSALDDVLDDDEHETVL